MSKQTRADEQSMKGLSLGHNFINPENLNKGEFKTRLEYQLLKLVTKCKASHVITSSAECVVE